MQVERLGLYDFQVEFTPNEFNHLKLILDKQHLDIEPCLAGLISGSLELLSDIIGGKP